MATTAARIPSAAIPHSCGKEDGSPSTCVQCLINSHASQISELREKVKDHIADEEHDGLWLLRYILSFKEVDKAVEPIQRAVKWRKEHGDLIDLVRKGGAHPPHHEVIDKLVATSLHKTKNDGGPVYVVRSGLSNPKLLMDTVPADDLLLWFCFEKEKGYEECDRVTRETGRLTKMVTINDMNHVSLMRGREKRFMKVLGDSSHLAEDLYPQLIDVNVMMNVPGFMKFMFAIAKALLPKRAFEKMRVCPGNTLKDDISKCPFVRMKVAISNVPTFLGGTCNCPGGCVPGVANSACHPLEEL